MDFFIATGYATVRRSFETVSFISIYLLQRSMTNAAFATNLASTKSLATIIRYRCLFFLE